MYQLMKKIGLLSLILAFSLGLTSCGTIRNLINPNDTPPPTISNGFVITPGLFSCGERPRNWPSEEELIDFSSPDIVDLANEYWFWGMRCEQRLHLVERYVMCNKGEVKACEEIDELRLRSIREAQDNIINN